mgnify:CR=1 FL=1|jgi:hypothetical protein
MTKRKRIRVTIKYAQIVTSSDRKRAFFINEVNIKHGVSKYRRPYVKIFGVVKYIKESEISEYVEHKVTVYYE